MATKTLVETPAGESIEVLEDRTWAELTSTDERSLRQWAGFKSYMIRALYEHGEFKEPTGRVTSTIMQYVAETYPNAPVVTSTGAVTGMMAQPVCFPAFEAVRNEKRTYSVKLVALPRAWFMKLSQMIADNPLPQPVEESPEPTADETEAVSAEQRIGLGETVGEPEYETVSDMDIQQLLDSIPGVDAPTIYDEMPAMDLSIATQVAMSLLTTCVEIITAGSGAITDERVRKLQGDYSEVTQRLSQRLAENDSLRRQLRQAGDEIRALRHERDGLRSRLRATEANLTAALKGDAINAINGEIQRRVDSIMRVTPTTRGD